MDDLSDFEFFKIMLDNDSRKLRLPDKFVELLDGREPREVKLREAGGGSRLWDVEVVFDGDGHMYLERGWDQFAREHEVGQGHFLVFSYDGDDELAVKVFDGTMCRRHYRYEQDDDDDSSTTPAPRPSQLVTVKEEELSISPGSESDSDDSGSENSIGSGGKNSVDDDGGSKNSSRSAEMDVDDAPTSQFSVMLRQCHLGVRQKQYLNVPVDFQMVYEYHKRSKVVLRMRGGRSWPVTLKHSPRAAGNPRTSLRYGWHQFCVDNRLDVGDTCFFRALRGGGHDAGRGEDHQLKVEVRKRDGAFLD
uniref:Uncharacterized protein n=1 Tax=Avena sativa TaxID=4498 RepID=A0ACD5TV63_AVESA